MEGYSFRALIKHYYTQSIKPIITSMRSWAIAMLIVGFTIMAWVLISGGYIFGGFHPDPAKATQIQPFVAALVTPFLTLGSTLLVLENLRTTSKQNFSNNFFKLIDQHHKLVDNINTWVEGQSSAQNPCRGREFFDELAERIACDYYYSDKPKVRMPNGKKQDPCTYTFKPSKIRLQGHSPYERVKRIYDYHFQVHHSALGHYFRNLYHLVRFADQSNQPDHIKAQHVKILRAQLSNYEILLLAYNAMLPYGKNFYELIEKYELLKNLNNEKHLDDSLNKRIIDLDVLANKYPHLKATEFLGSELYG